MRAQLLIESLFMLALAMSFVVFILFLFTGIYQHYQRASNLMDRMYGGENAAARAQVT